MGFIKFLLLLLILLPFALFLLYITDRLMDEVPKASAADIAKERRAEMSKRQRRRERQSRKRT